MKIVLASASSRRRQLLSRLIENFQVVVSDFDEDSVVFQGRCESYVMKLAEGKAKDVCRKLTNESSIVIGCDTAVFLRGKVMGKPRDIQEAFHMLKALSGNEHDVYSGIAIMDKVLHKTVKSFVRTTVKFSEIDDRCIKNYLKKGEYKDKAGAYGIQGYGGVFVKEIHGCYYNVVGLPLNKLYNMLSGMGVNL
ncbi:Maf-like protein [Clostridium kluyveri]|uniref:dTTP/UTP pyrophosphatase n=2 Tax=Clostridium kluyveri TaxID=1534 RepID=NTPPA_CLOK5|nr:Maf-like protein [Clostridium kluyveri]A5N6I4.1 RecName: Full=dTTP/UTP pyrophosphatase; Short=dTTPase/UTPase; AltName: Full=Nucleoside triphosphate pyrophosphatase; AltName: Full=Nucleotide pyrophosphatase; Short=Nucleotide PPase [Clostridium kluyveri DSM 555]B9E003.1 RecName: Full=dTTP/UTP pyrophosphatase; Short=dTTPase/UTPase; AltName: Full=Nucleoside triphosphate pyrophosphatase; AltName: Full=Nucleotide pyrophosphatase; Short=Nucleotide PPase [Clostridium kluyveri NBRC 12016]EDK32915.1 Ma